MKKKLRLSKETIRLLTLREERYVLGGDLIRDSEGPMESKCAICTATREPPPP